jgi:hypothetical protein
MQFRIIFAPGVGGDGFSALLEHANNIEPADGIVSWRQHKIVEGKLKFHDCFWVNGPYRPFRAPGIDAEPIPYYVDLINQGKNTVISSHYMFWDEIDQYPYREIVTRDCVYIHLYSTDIERVLKDNLIKNEISQGPTLEYYSKLLEQNLKRKEYHIHIDIEQVWQSWEYLKSCVDQLGIDLSESEYQTYMALIKSFN